MILPTWFDNIAKKTYKVFWFKKFFPLVKTSRHPAENVNLILLPAVLSKRNFGGKIQIMFDT